MGVRQIFFPAFFVHHLSILHRKVVPAMHDQNCRGHSLPTTTTLNSSIGETFFFFFTFSVTAIAGAPRALPRFPSTHVWLMWIPVSCAVFPSSPFADMSDSQGRQRTSPRFPGTRAWSARFPLSASRGNHPWSRRPEEMSDSRGRRKYPRLRSPTCTRFEQSGRYR